LRPEQAIEIRVHGREAIGGEAEPEEPIAQPGQQHRVQALFRRGG
jgi:hypothetical protein